MTYPAPGPPPETPTNGPLDLTGDTTRTRTPSALEAALRAVSDGFASASRAPGRLRSAVVRYAAVARELSLTPDEMLERLDALLGRELRRPSDAELAQHARWWAIHGYHRAD